MKRFSERMGLAHTPTTLQVGTMNEELRNSLWNVLDVQIWSTKDFMNVQHGKPKIDFFSKYLWIDFCKLPADERPDFSPRKLKIIRDNFFAYEWHKVYDFIEYVVSFYNDHAGLKNYLNLILHRELAGYCLIENKIVQITDEQEIAMLNEALKDTRFEGVSGHLKRALELMSDRQNPDYRNSIKESISAVEGIAKIIAGKPKATLTDAVNILEKNGKLHTSLKKGWEALYNYTSDGDGIRHAMLDEPDLSVADAKYFLLSCTSFVNYLKSQI